MIRCSKFCFDLRKLYAICYLFFCIFAPPVIPGINSFHFLFLYTVWVLIFKYNKSFQKILASKVCKRFFGGYGLLLGYVFTSMLLCIISGRINLMNEITQLYRYFMVVIELPVCAIYIALYCRKHSYDNYDMIKLIIAAGLIQAAFTVMMISSPGIKAAIVGYMSRTNGDSGSFLNMSAWEYARRYNAFSDNLQDALGWGTGIIASLALFISLSKHKKYLWIYPILILVPLFNAVTGVVFTIVTSFVIICSNILKGDPKAVKYLFLIAFGAIIFALILMTVNPFVYDWVSNNLLAIGRIGKGSSSTTSFGHLMNESNWRFPPNALSIIFGTGHNVMSDADGYHHADPGITNNVWLMGMVGTAYLYGFWTDVIRTAGNRSGRELRSIFISLGICLILFEIKGITNFYNPGLAVTILLIFSSLISRRDCDPVQRFY